MLELAILRLFRSSAESRPGKVVYIAPLRALCDERLRQWQLLFAPLHLRCCLCTSDSEPQQADIEQSDVIVCTPEKFDWLTRRREQTTQQQPHSLTQQLSVVCIDEAHLLNDSRGACLEGLVARCKLVQAKSIAAAAASASSASLASSSPPPPVCSLRFLALSATILNYRDLAEWLGEDCRAFSFPASYRPCPLLYHVHAFPAASNPFLFDRGLDHRIVDIIDRYSSSPAAAQQQQPQSARRRLPSLVFCCTRKGAIHTATVIIDEVSRRGQPSLLIQSEQQRAALHATAGRLRDRTLARTVERGVGFHHAGLYYEDREQLESAFLSSSLLVLCATSTLAQGVNLPAHLVVVKSTQYFARGSGWLEYDATTVLQMTGRAGRPQFDSEGVAVVMCEDGQRQRWQQIMDGLMPCESNFKPKLAEALNSEIVASAVSSPADAAVWLRHTFLHVRLPKNPGRYGVTAGGGMTPARRQQVEDGWLNADIGKLQSSGCLRPEADGRFVATEKGRVMSQHYLSLDTALLLDSITGSISLPQLLFLFAQAAEFSELHIKQGEKSALNSLLHTEGKTRGRKKQAKTDEEQTQAAAPAAAAAVPYQLPNGLKSVKETADKVFVLAQAAMCGRSLADSSQAFGLGQDVATIMGPGLRIARAFEQFVCSLPTTASVLAIKSCIQLRRSLQRRCLLDADRRTGRQLQQLTGIGPVYGKELAEAGLDSIDRLRKDGQERLSDHKGMRERAAAGLRGVPQFELQVEEAGSGRLELQVRQLNAAFTVSAKKEERGSHAAHVIVGLQGEGTVLLYQRFMLPDGLSDARFPLQGQHAICCCFLCRSSASST